MLWVSLTRDGPGQLGGARGGEAGCAADQPVTWVAFPAGGDRGSGAVEPPFPDLDEGEVAGDHQGEGEVEQARQWVEGQDVGERGGRQHRADSHHGMCGLHMGGRT